MGTNYIMTGFRNEEFFGQDKSLIRDVIYFEVFELENKDILEYCESHYKFNDDIMNAIERAKDDNLTKSELKMLVAKIVGEVSKITSKNLTRCIWLCDSIEDGIRAGYGENPGDFSEMNTTDVILSDLSLEGKLYAYTEEEYENRYNI